MTYNNRTLSTILAFTMTATVVGCTTEKPSEEDIFANKVSACLVLNGFPGNPDVMLSPEGTTAPLKGNQWVITGGQYSPDQKTGRYDWYVPDEDKIVSVKGMYGTKTDKKSPQFDVIKDPNLMRQEILNLTKQCVSDARRKMALPVASPAG